MNFPYNAYEAARMQSRNSLAASRQQTAQEAYNGMLRYKENMAVRKCNSISFVSERAENAASYGEVCGQYQDQLAQTMTHWHISVRDVGRRPGGEVAW